MASKSTQPEVIQSNTSTQQVVTVDDITALKVGIIPQLAILDLRFLILDALIAPSTTTYC